LYKEKKDLEKAKEIWKIYLEKYPESNGECRVKPSSFQYRLVPSPCGTQGSWSNWDNDQCGAHYPWYALWCLISVRGCGGLRIYPDANCP
ncbi:MAG: hypothetical protein NC827_07295, partial [Candidatus Omnitrophica bacterium]|nr:hypothetical protein [Candidatus Omnitrophota bacterium]